MHVHMQVERAGKVAALRLFLDLAVSMIYSRRAGEVLRYTRAVLRERYSGLDRIVGLARPTDDPVAACKFVGVPPRTVPVAQHVCVSPPLSPHSDLLSVLLSALRSAFCLLSLFRHTRYPLCRSKPITGHVYSRSIPR